MKKIIAIAASLFLASTTSIFAKAKTVTITTLNQKAQSVQIEVPYNPDRVAILDLAALDIIDNLGLGSRVVGSATTSIDYLSKYSPDKNKRIKNLGNVKQADMEAVFECEPDIIFIGGRLSASYDELSKIAPVVYLSTDINIGLVESVKKNAFTIARIFGKEKEVEEKFNGFDFRIVSLKEKADGHSAIIGMATSGSCNLLGDNGRLSLITNEVGFKNVGANLSGGSSGNSGKKSSRATTQSSPAHGEESSFELIAKLNPDYIFILDRDSAIGTNGAKLAKDIMDNEIIALTKAAKENHLIILSQPAIWYTAEGGITALGYMLKDLESHL